MQASSLLHMHWPPLSFSLMSWMRWPQPGVEETVGGAGEGAWLQSLLLRCPAAL